MGTDSHYRGKARAFLFSINFTLTSAPMNTCLKRPKMCPIFEIRHVSKQELVFPISFSKDQDCPGRPALCLTPDGILCTPLHSRMFFHCSAMLDMLIQIKLKFAMQ